MATSTIIENITVNNPKALEEYVKAMERAETDYHPRTEDEYSSACTDPEETREFMRKALARIGITL